MNAVCACFHCGLPVVEPGRHRAVILGEARELCCAGCEAVAGTIIAAGLDRYYATREAPSAVPPQRRELLPPSAAYDDPSVQAKFVAEISGGAREAILILDRIRCAACLWLNERYLRSLPGVLRVDINYSTRRATVAWAPERIRLSGILEAIRSIGYEAWPFDPERQRALDQDARRDALWRLFVAGFGAMQVMMYAAPAYLDGDGTLGADSAALMRWASLVLTLPVLLLSCQPFFISAWRELRAHRVGLDAPISIGVLAGFAASAWATLSGSGDVYFDSITMLVFLLLGARYVELTVRQRAARALEPLLAWRPQFAMRLPSPEVPGVPERVPAHALRVGDRVLVAAGESVPADGEVLEGEGAADESLMTGEARAVAKCRGAILIGGTVILDQPLVMRVTGVGADTRAAAIARLVERASAGKIPLACAADRIAAKLTGVVLGVALVAACAWWMVEPGRALWVAVAVLMVTCPCALALATPIAMTAATARLAHCGAILTRGAALQGIDGLTDIVLDKTGTLTEGRLRLDGVELLGKSSARECEALAAALESGSRHPIARAILDCAVNPAFAGATVNATRHFPGFGVEARDECGRRLRLGSARFVSEIAGAVNAAAAQPAGHGRSSAFLAREGEWLAQLRFEDRPRAGACALVARLQARGLEVHLLSGDEPGLVRRQAELHAIATWRGGASPQDKFAYVEALRRGGRKVAMVGDGVNDAPVLAAADVSIAMGDGAALAQQQADVVLLEGRLEALDAVLECGRRTTRVVRQNLAWATGYNALALPLAACGWIGPWEAALGMAASSVLVVLNAARLMPRPGDALKPVFDRTWKASTYSYR
ncbi:MAG: heavy metal translocating P-type ATPase [Betaproteobacteria bacterium]|nr:heavy metal translocating P-type ATPase [Betaproteobacteria bacterium]